MIMRKALVTVLAGSLLLLSAAPAFAAPRDPFVPLVSQDALGNGNQDGDGTGDANGDGTGTGTGNEDPNGAPGGSDPDGLPNTGGDTAPWLVAAYALIASGAVLLAVGKLRGPIPY